MQSQREWQSSITEMRRTADRLAWLSLVSALLLALAMTLLISWPLRKLQAKIARMSDGARLQDWRQSGPADLQRLALELAQLDRRLAALEEQKGRFFRQVSHELKTRWPPFTKPPRCCGKKCWAACPHSSRKSCSFCRTTRKPYVCASRPYCAMMPANGCPIS